MLNLLFRSENEGVEKRVRRTQPEQVHYLLPQEPEQLALNYFFNNYVLIPRKSDAAHGYMEVLPVLYANLAPNSPLLSATSALAFAAFGKDAFGRQFFPNTRLKYGEAIVRLNEALGDPVAVRKDETLMAVLIMGMVEVCAPAAWCHVLPCTKHGLAANAYESGPADMFVLPDRYLGCHIVWEYPHRRCRRNNKTTRQRNLRE